MSNGEGWKTRSVDELITVLESDPTRGLNKKKIAEKRRKWGRNNIWFTGSNFMFLKPESGFSFLGYIIMAISAFSAAVFGKSTDALYSGIILVTGTIISIALYIAAGIVNSAHCKQWIPKSKVIRDGDTIEISGEDLVPGDIVILEKGDTSCADLKLISSNGLSVREFSATGKKGVIQKESASLLLAEEGQVAPEDYVFAASEVISGSGKALVCATGKRTVIGEKGKINLIPEKEPYRLSYVRRKSMAAGTLAILFSFIVVTIGLFSGLSSSDFTDLFLVFLSFAVSCAGEIMPVLYCFMYVLFLDRSESGGVLIRDASAMDSLLGCSAIAVESTVFMKTGTSKLTSAFYCGKVTDPSDDGINELFSLLIAGTNSGKEKHGATLLKALNDHFDNEEKTSKFISDTEMSRIVSEHTVDGHLHHSLFIYDGKHFFAITGAIEEVIGNCTKIRINDTDFQINQKHLSYILRTASDASKSASSIIAIAVRESPYNNMRRLSVLKDQLTFIGFIAVDSPADPELSDEIVYLKHKKIPFFFFTDGNGEDVNFARRLGVIKSKHDLVSSENPDEATKKALSEYTAAVVAKDSDKKSTILKAFNSTGKRVVCIGSDNCMKGHGFFVTSGNPRTGSGAAINSKKHGSVSALIKSLRLAENLSKKLRIITVFLAASSVLRAVYSIMSIFGFGFVYPWIILVWGIIFDTAVSFAILCPQRKNR